MFLFRKPALKIQPGKSACPLGCDISGFMRLAAAGKNSEALAVMKKDLPLPLACGHSCGCPCMADVKSDRKKRKYSLLRQKVLDSELEAGERFIPESSSRVSYGDRIAVIGAGPAGLSCAYYLALKGYRHVTVYDKCPAPGGMLAYGVPALKVNRSLLHAEITALREMGIGFRCGVEVGKDVTIAQMRDEGYKCFVIAVGAGADIKPGIDGEDLSGVYGGGSLLKGYLLGTAFSINGRCAVLGGGELAATIAGIADMLGASAVTLIHDGPRETMTASAEALEKASAKGVEIRCSCAVREILSNAEGRVRGIVTEKTVQRDISELTRSVPVGTGEFEELPFDNIIYAIGRKPEISALDPDNELLYNLDGTVSADLFSGKTTVSDIFACGELLTGSNDILAEIRSGRASAGHVHKYLHP